MTRYALSRREPLLVAARGVRRPRRRRPGRGHRHARGGRRDRRDGRGRAGQRRERRGGRAGPVRFGRGALMRAVVVALGKIGLPLAAQIARAGHEVVGCDIDERVVDERQRRPRAVPRRGRARRGAGRGRRRRPPARADGHARAPSPRARTSSSPCRRWSSTTPRSRTGACSTRSSPTSARACGRERPSSIETTLPVGTTRARIAPALEAASGLEAERDFFTVFSPERVYSGRVFADLATLPEARRRAQRGGRARAASSSTRRSSTPRSARWARAEAAELAKLAETTYRDINIAFANELARFADGAGIDVERVIDAANSQPFSHIHRPGIAVGGHCIPVYPRFYLAGDPDAALPAAGRAVNDAMPGYAVARLAELAGDLAGAARADPRRRLPRRRQGDRVQRRVRRPRRAARAAARGRVAADPLYDARRARGARASSPGTAAPVDAAIVQADHAEYARARARTTCPARGAILDGRGVLDAGARSPRPASPVRRLGRPDA